MKQLSALLSLSLLITACGLGSGGKVSVACTALTGRYEQEDRTVTEITQDGCGPNVNIEYKTIGINGQSFEQDFVLDGVRKLEPGGTEQDYRFFTRTWANDTWIDKWERYEQGALRSVTTSLFYLNAQGDLVFQDGDDPANRRVYRRLK